MTLMDVKMQIFKIQMMIMTVVLMSMTIVTKVFEALRDLIPHKPRKTTMRMDVKMTMQKIMTTTTTALAILTMPVIRKMIMIQMLT